jgi:glycylpeptide N-tetradecanoyltransferase
MDNEQNTNESIANEQVQGEEKVKKSKKRSKNKKTSAENAKTESPHAENSADNNEAMLPTSLDSQEVMKTLKALNLTDLRKLSKEVAGSTKVYKFWNTQPVPKINEASEEMSESEFHKAIEADKAISEIKQDPYALPEGFVWDTLDLTNEVILKELYTLLNENYVEDDDAMFRFDYQPDFLRWALQPPEWRKEWHAGVRVSKSGRLIAFISAIPAHIRVYDKQVKVVEINFLCVHKKLRSKRLAPVLIREITRRVNLTGIFQAVYTAGVVLPKPVTTCRYWHRSINPRKLIEVKFVNLNFVIDLKL